MFDAVVLGLVVLLQPLNKDLVPAKSFGCHTEFNALCSELARSWCAVEVIS